MAINNITWSPKEQITSSKLNQMVANGTNSTDDIHPQYNGTFLYDGRSVGLGGGGLSNPTARIDGFPNDASTGIVFNLLPGVGSRTWAALWVSFKIKNTISLDIDFDFITFNTNTSHNAARYQIYKHADGLSTFVTEGTFLTSVTWTRSSIVPSDLNRAGMV